MSDDQDIPDPGDKYEGIGCMLICLAIALLIAAGPIVAIIEAIKK